MANFAELDEQNTVINVICVHNNELLDAQGNESELLGIQFLESLYGHSRWKQTSINASFRKNYAGIGSTYNPDLDAFILPQPEGDGWVLNETTLIWENPNEVSVSIGVTRV